MSGSASPYGQGHRVWVRLCHWLIAASVLTLAYSGIVILMAHPRLYWGNAGNDLTRALIELPLGRNYRHGGWTAATPFFGTPGGPVTAVRTYDIFNQNGWARSLHFLVAWLLVASGLVYGLIGLATGHLRRDLVPGARDLAPHSLWADIVNHLRMPLKAAAGGPPYGPLQKLAYFGVVCVALPAMVLTGLAMSPQVAAGLPWLQPLLGGQQSARTLHFAFLCLLTLFLIVHLAMVLLSGAGRQMLGMTLGLRRTET